MSTTTPATDISFADLHLNDALLRAFLTEVGYESPRRFKWQRFQSSDRATWMSWVKRNWYWQTAAFALPVLR